MNSVAFSKIFSVFSTLFTQRIRSKDIFVTFLLPSVILSTKYRDDINLPFLEHVARRRPLLQRAVTVSSQRDREMRDCIFEKR